MTREDLFYAARQMFGPESLATAAVQNDVLISEHEMNMVLYEVSSFLIKRAKELRELEIKTKIWEEQFILYALDHKEA